MEPARLELADAINSTNFNTPICPIYQNATALRVTDPLQIKQNLIDQLTAPVLWTQMVQHMIADGADNFIEIGPGNVLQGLIAKIGNNVETSHG
jgi:[acyl-carrier-protein] S-malonyltransferase